MTRQETALLELGQEAREAYIAAAKAQLKQQDIQDRQAGRLMLQSVYVTLDEDQQMLLDRGLELVTGVSITRLLPKQEV